MKGFWNLICVLTLFAAIVLFIVGAGSYDYSLLELGEKPEDVNTMFVYGLVLMIPSALTAVYHYYKDLKN